MKISRKSNRQFSTRKFSQAIANNLILRNSFVKIRTHFPINCGLRRGDMMKIAGIQIIEETGFIGSGNRILYSDDPEFIKFANALNTDG